MHKEREDVAREREKEKEETNHSCNIEITIQRDEMRYFFIQ